LPWSFLLSRQHRCKTINSLTVLLARVSRSCDHENVATFIGYRRTANKSLAPEELRGNRRRGNGGMRRIPSLLCHLIQASSVSIPAGTFPSAFQNSCGEMYCSTSFTSAGEPQTIKCAKNVGMSSSVGSTESYQTTLRATRTKSVGHGRTTFIAQPSWAPGSRVKSTSCAQRVK
jgi:hypothetical protein